MLSLNEATFIVSAEESKGEMMLEPRITDNSIMTIKDSKPCQQEKEVSVNENPRGKNTSKWLLPV